MIANLLISLSIPKRIEEIDKILTKVGLKNSHPDLLYFPSDAKLGIEQARKIKEHFSLKPYSAKGRVVVLEDASKLTDEAQNALLKTLEELPEHALFILGAASESKLLPTVISRCEIINIPPSMWNVHTPSTHYAQDIEKLLESTIEQRFDYIENLKDREAFSHSLVEYFHQKLNDPTTHARSDLANLSQFLEELLQAEEWAKQNVNIRAILEYLMLVMPKRE